MLKNVMRRYDAVGLAAPQIGIPLQIFAIEFLESKQKEFSTEVYANRQMKTVPFRVCFRIQMFLKIKYLSIFWNQMI